jgi:hypothetical protein
MSTRALISTYRYLLQERVGPLARQVTAVPGLVDRVADLSRFLCRMGIMYVD